MTLHVNRAGRPLTKVTKLNIPFAGAMHLDFGALPAISRLTKWCRAGETRGRRDAGGEGAVTEIPSIEVYASAGSRTDLRRSASRIAIAATDALSAAIVVVSRDSITITCSRTVGSLCST